MTTRRFKLHKINTKRLGALFAMLGLQRVYTIRRHAELSDVLDIVFDYVRFSLC